MMTCRYPDLGSASDWLCHKRKFALNNQKQYPDLGSEHHQYGIMKCQLFCKDTSLHEGTLVMQVHVVYKQNPSVLIPVI